MHEEDATMATGLTPWTGLTSLRQEMDRLFDRFFVPGDEGTLTGWAPRLDLSETKDALVVKAEIPGVDPKDIQVSMQDQMLVIKGEKQQEKEEKDERYHRVERSYGAFARTVRLPSGVDAGKVTASFKNGLLTVTLPKTPAAKGTAIPIKNE
jgi:HSP20 family protein